MFLRRAFLAQLILALYPTLSDDFLTQIRTLKQDILQVQLSPPDQSN